MAAIVLVITPLAVVKSIEMTGLVPTFMLWVWMPMGTHPVLSILFMTVYVAWASLVTAGMVGMLREIHGSNTLPTPREAGSGLFVSMMLLSVMPPALSFIFS